MKGRILTFDDSAHHAADELLPWFVNGTLRGHELAAVEQHVRECARCRREVDLLQQLQAVCVEEGPATDATPSFRRLQGRIAGRGRLRAVRDRAGDVVRSWQRAPTWARWAIAAEFAAVVVLGATLAMPAGEPGGVYRTLGAPDARAGPDGTIAVVFVPEATESELRRIVQAAGARVVDGPTESNAYVLAVRPGHRDAALAVLAGEPAVTLAQPLTARPDR